MNSIHVLILPFSVPRRFAGDGEDRPSATAGARQDLALLLQGLEDDLSRRLALAPGVEADQFSDPIDRLRGEEPRVIHERLPMEEIHEEFGELLDTYDSLIHCDVIPADPFELTVQILRPSDGSLRKIASFVRPRSDGFSAIVGATRFVLETIGAAEIPPKIEEFPARSFAAWLHLLRGRELLARHRLLSDPTAAVDAFEPFFDALSEEPGLFEAVDSIARTVASDAADERLPLEVAEEMVERLLVLEPDHPDTQHALAVVRELGKDLDGAREALERAAATAPDPHDKRFHLALLLDRMDRREESVAILTTLLDGPNLDVADAAAELGRIRAAMGDGEGAVEALEDALRRDPDHPYAWGLLSAELAKLGRAEEAQEAIARGLAQPSPTPAIHSAAGRLHYEGGRFAEAAEFYEKMLGTGEDDEDGFRAALASCLLKTGETVRALHHLRRMLYHGGGPAETARRLLPKDVDADREERLVEELHRAERSRRSVARTMLATLVRVEPTFADAWFRLGRVYGAEGRLPKAVRCYRRAAELAPDEVETWCAMGKTLWILHRVPDAVDAMRRAVDLFPSGDLHRAALAMLLLQDGRSDEAMAELDQVKRIRSRRQ